MPNWDWITMGKIPLIVHFECSSMTRTAYVPPSREPSVFLLFLSVMRLLLLYFSGFALELERFPSFPALVLTGACKNVDHNPLLTRLLQSDEDRGRCLSWRNFCSPLHLHNPGAHQSSCKSCPSAARLSELNHGCRTDFNA